MRRRLVSVLVLAATAGFVCGPASAKETTLGVDADAFNRRWLRDLRSDDFRVREEACARIADAGADAIAPLKDAAGNMDRETAARCLGLLERLAQSSEANTSRAAKEALGALEGSSNPAVADLARSALVKLEKLPPPLLSRYPFGPPIGFNMQVQLRGGNGLRISTRSINGERTTTIEEPGKKTTITDNSGKDIRVSVTDIVNGAQKTTEYEGKDLDDLRRKFPAGAEIYERYNRQAAPVVDIQKQMDDVRARTDKLRALSQESFDLRREQMQLKRENQEGTEKYADLEKRIEQNREAQLQALRR